MSKDLAMLVSDLTIRVRYSELTEALNGQEFYELMQAYRNAPIDDQLDVASAFGEVKKFILSSIIE